MVNSNNYEMELDESYYQKLLKADFFTRDNMIFVKDFVKDFDGSLKKYSERGYSKQEIEKYMNHVVMEFVSTFPEKQKVYAEKIIENWKKKLKEKFPERKFALELSDDNGGYTIYLYTGKNNFKKNDPKNTMITRELL